MIIQAQFGKNSLPLAVRDHLAEHYPAIPRPFVQGLRAVADAAFSDDDGENLERLERAARILKTADYYAPEFYAHTNSKLPDSVMLALAGEAELECSEDLDASLSRDAQDLMAELRYIREDIRMINAPETSGDARFTALVRLYHEMDDYLDMLHSGETDIGGDAFADTHIYQQFLRDEIIDPENSQLETALYQLMRRIDLVHIYGGAQTMWYTDITRDERFEEMDMRELLQRSGIPASDVLENALALSFAYRTQAYNLDKTQVFVVLAEDELGAIRQLVKHYENPEPEMLAYLLLKYDLEDEAMMEATLNALGVEGERIAYWFQAHEDPVLYASLPADERDIQDDFVTCGDMEKLRRCHEYLKILEPEDLDYEQAYELLCEMVDEQEAALARSGIIHAPSLSTQMERLCNQSDMHDALYAYKTGREDVPEVMNIDQKMAPHDLRDYLVSLEPANG